MTIMAPAQGADQRRKDSRRLADFCTQNVRHFGLTNI